MSSVIRPAGPLPSRVYWVRRLLLVAAVVVLFSLVWWTVGRAFGGPSEPASTTGAESSPAGGVLDSGAGPGGGGGQDPGGHGSSNPAAEQKDDHRHDKGGQDKDGKGQQKGKHQEPELADPSGPCSPAQVGLQVVVDDAHTGHTVPIKLRFTSLATQACTLALTPDTLMVRITADDQVIWSSDDCPDELMAKELTVRTRPATTYTFDWGGGASSGGCGSGSVVEAGSYQAEAALIGGTTRTASFMIG